MTATKEGSRGARPPFQRTPAWLDAFHAQLRAKGFYVRMERFARGRAAIVAMFRKIDAYYADELLQDVLTDTFMGRIVWDPSRVDLARHVSSAMKSRSRHHYERARDKPHESLHGDNDSDADESSLLALDEEVAKQATDPDQLARRRNAAAIYAAIRQRASDDPDVLLVLDAYVDEERTKSEVMAATGLSAQRYHAARDRLRHLRSRLPSYLND